MKLKLQHVGPITGTVFHATIIIRPRWALSHLARESGLHREPAPQEFRETSRVLRAFQGESLLGGVKPKPHDPLARGTETFSGGLESAR